jgi:uncharacterized protein
MIYETIVTTLNADGSVHIAPMGVRSSDGHFLIAPFKPSTTLENIDRDGVVIVNLTDDVRVFAGCITGHRYDWPTEPAERIRGQRLSAALSHLELQVERKNEDDLRPVFHCRLIHEAVHAPFRGFNRAQAAVLEAAILASRLDRLSPVKIAREIEYLSIAIDKTAGRREQEAWDWLMERVSAHLHATAAAGKAE